MPIGKLSPEGDVISAYGAAMVAAFQCSSTVSRKATRCCPARFPDALKVYMEMVKSRTGGVSDIRSQCSTTFGWLR